MPRTLAGRRLLSGLRSGLRDQSRTLARPLLRVWSAALAWWRRSLQGRVLIKAMLFSAVVIAVAGWLLLRQIGDGLVERRAEFAVRDSAQATLDAVRRLSAVDARAGDGDALLSELTTLLTSRGATQGYDVVVRGPLNKNRQAGAGTRLSPGVLYSSVPPDLQDAVTDAGAQQTSWTYTTINYLRADGTARTSGVPGVAVGALVELPGEGSRYAVYYLFPLDQEREAFGLVRQSLLTSGLLLLLLIAALTALLSRQVVRPVRGARRVAERLAAGELRERLEVHGTDDLARLAVSFNHMAESLQGQIMALEHMSEAQRRFVSDVSHELRTPLTTVRMATEVLHDARADFEPLTARSAELLHREVDRFDVLLAHLLEISRFDAGAASLRLTTFDVADAVASVVASLEALAEVHHATLLIFGPPPQESLTVTADRMRVERIIGNLLSNAIDYSGSARVEVRLSASPDAVGVLVQDFGIGLAPADHQRVFSRFWRADQSRDRATGGTGLGLSIAQEDARLHGGDLAAWGELGRGSQFLLILPRTPHAPVTQPPAEVGHPWWEEE